MPSLALKSRKKVNKLKTPKTWQLIVSSRRFLERGYGLAQYSTHYCIQEGRGEDAFIDDITYPTLHPLHLVYKMSS